MTDFLRRHTSQVTVATGLALVADTQSAVQATVLDVAASGNMDGCDAIRIEAQWTTAPSTATVIAVIAHTAQDGTNYTDDGVIVGIIAANTTDDDRGECVFPRPGDQTKLSFTAYDYGCTVTVKAQGEYWADDA